jgi:hypothetical protein
MSVVIALTEHIGTLQVIGQHLAVPMAIDNPIGDVVPNFSIFGVEFDAWWKKLFGGAWAVLIVMSIFYLAVGFQEMAKSDDSNPHQHAAGKKKAKNAGVGLVGLAALGVIVTAILAVVG